MGDGMKAPRDGRLLARALSDPHSVAALDGAGWQALLTMARAELLSATLAYRLDGIAMPEAARRFLAEAKLSAEQGRTAALWEIEMTRRAFAADRLPVILLKGSAFIAAGLKAGQGRFVGDLDILVPRGDLDRAEAALFAAGWEWVKADPYDDAYYRQWMHELPPMIHAERDRMIDVHHTILPLTARPTPDALAMIADRVELRDGIAALSPNDMICHAAAHLFADGEMLGAMRNLWDIHCLIEEFGTTGLAERAMLHGLSRAVARAVRQAIAMFGTPVDDEWRVRDALDPLFARRITARDGWGRATRPVTQFAFYVRGHWLRMPPHMLARHLWTKWRKGRA